MSSLYRCRCSTQELRALFSCEVPPQFHWRGSVHPRQPGLVIRREGRKLVAENMRWGLPAPEGSGRQYVWTEQEPFSKLAFKPEADRPRRCLVVLDSFAFPGGPRGRRTRNWFGLWDEPLFAWAGLWRETDGAGPAYIAAVTRSNALVRPFSAVMPVILRRPDYESWLFGDVKLALSLWRRSCEAGAMWLERTDEMWSSGTSLGELEAQEAFASSRLDFGRRG